MTQSQLALRVGTTQSNIARMEKLDSSGWPNVTLEQLDIWCRATEVAVEPAVAFDDYLGSLSMPRNYEKLRAARKVLSADADDASHPMKPNMLICGDSSDGSIVATQFIRNLICTGDRLFCGFYLPSESLSVVFKHISCRPLWAVHNAYRVRGSLTPEKVVAPLSRISEIVSSGSLVVLEKDENLCYGVVYFDHPVLMYMDIVHFRDADAACLNYSGRTLFSAAHTLVLGCGAGMGLTSGSIIKAAVAGRPWDCVVGRSSANIDVVIEECFELLGRRPYKISLLETGEFFGGSNMDALCGLMGRVLEILDSLIAAQVNSIVHGISGDYGGIVERSKMISQSEFGSAKARALLRAVSDALISWPLTKDFEAKLRVIESNMAKPQFGALHIKDVNILLNMLMPTETTEAGDNEELEQCCGRMEYPEFFKTDAFGSYLREMFGSQGAR